LVAGQQGNAVALNELRATTAVQVLDGCLELGKIKAHQCRKRAQGNEVLAFAQIQIAGHAIKRDAIAHAMKPVWHVMLAWVIDQDAVRAKGFVMQVPGLLVKGQQDVELIAQGRDWMDAHPKLEHHRAPLDLGRVGAEGMDVVAIPGHGPGQHISG
jgi:hypothetical protein